MWREYLADRRTVEEPLALKPAVEGSPDSASSFADGADATRIASVPDERAASAQSARAEARRAVLDPLLRERGWSTLDWAQAAHVDFHTTTDYLKGLTKPRRDTLKKLAEALGVAVTSMPE